MKVGVAEHGRLSEEHIQALGGILDDFLKASGDAALPKAREQHPRALVFVFLCLCVLRFICVSLFYLLSFPRLLVEMR